MNLPITSSETLVSAQCRLVSDSLQMLRCLLALVAVNLIGMDDQLWEFWDHWTSCEGVESTKWTTTFLEIGVSYAVAVLFQ